MRALTFLDSEEIDDQTEKDGFVVAHSILAVTFFIAVLQGLYETRRKHYLYERYSLRYIFPWAAFVQALENATIAVNVAGNNINNGWASVVLALQATVAPCLLLSTFDVTYSIHKTRHMNFCGAYDGQTGTKNPWCTLAIKTLIRLLALILLAIGIVVNFDLIQPSSPYAGRTGWYWVISEPWQEENVHVIMALVPVTTLSLINFYFAFALWRYGTSYSMVVHASPFNPWFSPFFGDLALMAGIWFGLRWYPLLSNLGMFCFVESILLLFSEVNKDMEAATELRDFLSVIGGKRTELTRLDRSERRDEEEAHQEELTPLQAADDNGEGSEAKEEEKVMEN